jgi:hypothetical protein
MSPEYVPPVHWRQKRQRYRLEGEICPHCETLLFPPRDICISCGQEAHTPYRFSGKGEVYSFTTLYDAPAGFEEQAPYMVAIIKLAEGPLVTAQITDLGNSPIEIGTQVEMVTRRLKQDGDDRGLVVYGYKFRPILESSNQTTEA